MSTLDRSGQFIDEAVTLLDQADDIERAARDGDEVVINNQKLRGEALLPHVEQARDATLLPLATSIAINLERIANALEAASSFEPDGTRLERFSTAEISAELADRLAGSDHDGREL